MDQEFGQDSAGMAYLYSTMSEALTRETVRGINDSVWLGVGIILSLLTQMPHTWTGRTWKIGLSWAVDWITYTDFSVQHGSEVPRITSHTRVSESEHSTRCRNYLALEDPALEVTQYHFHSTPLAKATISPSRRKGRRHRPSFPEGVWITLQKSEGVWITLQKSMGNNKYYRGHLWDIQPDTRLFLSKPTLNLQILASPTFQTLQVSVYKHFMYFSSSAQY